MCADENDAEVCKADGTVALSVHYGEHGEVGVVGEGSASERARESERERG
jgi:hypothetical protein